MARFPRNPQRYKKDLYSYPSIESFRSAELRNGVHSIAYADGHLDLMVEDRGAEATIIFFHGAIPMKKITLPVFSGSSVAAELNANLVFVSDPGLERGTNLAWYTGDAGRNLQEDLPVVLDHVLGNFPHHKHAITYGGSGGGFAALIYASKISNCTALAANPQTNIQNYIPSAVERFTDACWDGLPLSALPVTTNASDIYEHQLDTRVVYLQAMGDEHVTSHMQPFFERVHPANQVGMRFLWNGVGHRAPEKELVKAILEDTINSQGDWHNLAHRLSLLTDFRPQSLPKLQAQYLTGLP